MARARRTWSPGSGVQANCQRTQAGYYAYTGDATARVAQLESTLTRIGWGGFTFSPGRPATAGQPATPAVLQAGYVASQTAPAGKAGLIISWLSPAQTRAVRRQQVRPGSLVAAGGLTDQIGFGWKCHHRKSPKT